MQTLVVINPKFINSRYSAWPPFRIKFMVQKKIGVIKWLSKDNTFGFIESSDKDYFINRDSIQDIGSNNLPNRTAILFKSNGFLAKEIELLK